MKTRGVAIIVMLILAASTVSFAGAATQAEILVVVQGKNIEFSKAVGMPVIDDNGRTQIPLRVVAESVGCSVEWDKVSRSAIITSGDISLIMPLNDEHILMNGQDCLIDTCAQIKENRTYIPARILFEALGYDVAWDAGKKVIKIEKMSKSEKGEYLKSLGFSKLKKGDKIFFGHYEQDGNLANGNEPIEWKVVKTEDEKALLLSEKILFIEPFKENVPDVVNGVIVGTGLGGGGPITWIDSTLRKDLNCSFINEAFSSKERLCIPYVLNDNEEMTSYLDVWWHRTGEATFDKAFCITQEEVESLLDDSERSATPTIYATSRLEDEGLIVPKEDNYIKWWLRSPTRYDWGSVAVGSEGYIGTYRYNYVNIGVRPAIWVSIT